MVERRVFRIRWRRWLRALHRDLGYLAVGLTVIYAVSGIAVNHIGDWDPSFEQVHERATLSTPLPADDDAVARSVATHWELDPRQADVVRMGDEELLVAWEQATVVVNTRSGVAILEGQKPRPLLRLANWLHLNRGKKAWTRVADTYAVVLLFLALSGLFMIGGSKGLWGRGGLLVTVGAAVPVVYVWLSGGP